ncbi:YadA-like family protein [Escherichia coli]|nr:calcium-binding protein [Escherichia coli]EID5415463.1 YadA-like family protein [Escherichia coli]ELM8689520.1 YadA-like family protein [Escherichia coli]ELP1668672.1 YadA-like family protein [Escherichia coli]
MGLKSVAGGQYSISVGTKNIAGNFTDIDGNPVVINIKDSSYEVFDTDGNLITQAGSIDSLLANHKIIVNDSNEKDNQFVHGAKNFASGSNSTAWGYKTIATGNKATSFGQETAATNNDSTAWGEMTVASGVASTAFGYKSQASGHNATAFGSNTVAAGNGSTAFGSYTSANAGNSVAFGNNSTVSGATVTIDGVKYSNLRIQRYLEKDTGKPVNYYYLEGTDDSGTLWRLGGVSGDKITVDGVEHQLSLSKGINMLDNSDVYNYTPGDSDAWEGVDVEARDIVKKWITDSMGGSLGGEYSIAFGQGSRVDARNSISGIGATVNSGSENSVALGNGAIVGNDATDSIAIGNEAEIADGKSNNIAIGKSANAMGGNGSDLFSLAVGQNSYAGGDGNSVALGISNRAEGADSVSIGTDNIVSGSRSGAFGHNNLIATNNTFAIGNHIANTIDNSVFLGNNSSFVNAGSTAGVDIYNHSEFTPHYFAGAAPVGIISVGDKGEERRIQNVAAGLISPESTDAINGSQLYAIADQFDKDINVIYDSIGELTAVKMIAGNNIDIAQNDNDVTISTKRDVEFDSVTIGSVKVDSDGIYAGKKKVKGVSDGDISNISQDAVNGSQLYATNQNVTNITNTVNKGLNFNADSGSVVNRQLGNTVDITGDGNIKTKTTDTGVNVTLNKNINLGNKGSVSIGNTMVNTHGVVINGGPSMTQEGINAGNNTITNVAPGVNNTDAVNVEQMNSAFSNIGKNIQNLNNRIEHVEKNANAGVAEAIATAGLPQAYLPGKSMMAIGGGSYHGETGYAIGYSTISDNGRWIFKGTGSGNSRGNFGGSVGVGYQW